MQKAYLWGIAFWFSLQILVQMVKEALGIIFFGRKGIYVSFSRWNEIWLEIPFVLFFIILFFKEMKHEIQTISKDN